MEDSQLNQLLSHVLSQYAVRPHGSVNEKLALAQFRGELQKVCDEVEEEPVFLAAYLTRFKYLFVGTLFLVVSLVSLLNAIATVVCAFVGLVVFWVVYGLQPGAVDTALASVMSANVVGLIRARADEAVEKQTLLFVAHIDDPCKDPGVVVHVARLFVDAMVYVVPLLYLAGLVVGLLGEGLEVFPLYSVASVCLTLLCGLLLFRTPANKVSGLATALSLVRLAQTVRQNADTALDTVNVMVLITPAMDERHAGVRAFIRRHREDPRLPRGRTTVVCVDELDDSETLCCYTREGLVGRAYAAEARDVLKDAADAEDVPLAAAANRVHTPFTAAHEFHARGYCAAPLTAKCRGLKRRHRLGEERKLRGDGCVVCVHADQVECIRRTARVLYRACRLVDAQTVVIDRADSARGSSEPLGDAPIEL